jgi:cytochrome c oxidase cbb3-type subunit 2
LSARSRQIEGRLALAVAATYVAFLLCAQFGFLAQVEKLWSANPRALHAILTAMGLGGLGGGVAAALLVPSRSLPSCTRGALLSVALACWLSQTVAGLMGALVAAAALGSSLGFVTVLLAGTLDRWVSRRRVPWVAGLGTGAAYLFSNLPWFFSGTPSIRALAPAALCGVAAWLVPDRCPEETDGAPEMSGQGGRPVRFVGWLLAFAALVAVDSAAFAHVQKAPRLLAVSWGEPLLALRQGGLHLLGALLAGRFFDRRRGLGVLTASAVAFALGLPLLAAAPGMRSTVGAMLYALGIGAYSAALVAAPTASGGSGGLRRAAWLYSIAGWLASGVGVAIAESAGARALAWAGAAGFAFYLASEIGLDRMARGRLVPLGALAVAAWGVVAFGRSGLPAEGPIVSDPVARGRRVYVAEGCQHCHSQFVRPATHDEVWWGPAAPLDRSQQPPTPGNRRIGPDLAMVGLRRASLWQEVHLRAPATLSPGSRMPSYAHLFGDSRGQDLVVYLSSLGADRSAERQALRAGNDPLASAGEPDASHGAALFARYCAPCHGRGGRGDGGALGLSLPTMNLTKGYFVRLPPAGPDDRRRELAGIIRFGVPGGLMPGHEWLSDQEVADLAAFVSHLAGSS